MIIDTNLNIFNRQYIKIDSLKNSYETQKFTERLNLLFDVLNRKYPAEGIKKNCNDFKVGKYAKYSIYVIIIQNQSYNYGS